MPKFTTEIDLQINPELHEILLVSGICVTQESIQELTDSLDPTKTYLEIMCNKSFRKVIESANRPLNDTNKEISRLFYKLLLEKYYDSQLLLCKCVFGKLQLPETFN